MFRVGDIVKRSDAVPVETLGTGELTVTGVNPTGTHISFNGTTDRYFTILFKLVKPVWQVGDTAKVIRCTADPERVGYIFTVGSIEMDQVSEKGINSGWSMVNIERIALAPAPAVSPLDLVALQFSELKTTLARELEIPTYLYDVVEVKPLIKGGTVVMDDAWSVHVDRYPDKLELRNIGGPILTAERLRKLAKLCTDLADLMG